MIANCCLPLSLPGNRHFQLGLQKLEAKATTVSRTVMMDKYLPRCAKMVADLSLRGYEAKRYAWLSMKCRSRECRS